LKNSFNKKVNKKKTGTKAKQDFFNKVYDVAKKIPYGKVTTYGHIAEVCGIKSAARTVGWALNGCGPDIPAHRVVNRYGALTGKIHFGDPNLMEDLLRCEGIEFDKNDCVNLDRFLWIPKHKKRRKS
jgi:methylated-DNA-protein-cysteine methyltransferase-like protein